MLWGQDKLIYAKHPLSICSRVNPTHAAKFYEATESFDSLPQSIRSKPLSHKTFTGTRDSRHSKWRTIQMFLMNIDSPVFSFLLGCLNRKAFLTFLLSLCTGPFLGFCWECSLATFEPFCTKKMFIATPFPFESIRTFVIRLTFDLVSLVSQKWLKEVAKTSFLWWKGPKQWLNCS